MLSAFPGKSIRLITYTDRPMSAILSTVRSAGDKQQRCKTASSGVRAITYHLEITYQRYGYLLFMGSDMYGGMNAHDVFGHIGFVVYLVIY